MDCKKGKSLNLYISVLSISLLILIKFFILTIINIKIMKYFILENFLYLVTLLKLMILEKQLSKKIYYIHHISKLGVAKKHKKLLKVKNK